jgi:hypothetical protein
MMRASALMCAALAGCAAPVAPLAPIAPATLQLCETLPPLPKPPPPARTRNQLARFSIRLELAREAERKRGDSCEIAFRLLDQRR